MSTSPESQTAQQRASGSSFYLGMRLLPREEREAMFAIYAFSRAVDDIADEGGASRDERRAELDAWRRDIAAVYAGGTALRAAFLDGPIRRYGLRREDFFAVIDGMEMDVIEDIRAPDLATLALYCDRVACAVGRLSIKVFGMEEGPGFDLAHHLGSALQLTNILRDLDEDAGVGRLYLPRELLDAAGISSNDPATVIADPNIGKPCVALASLAREHYANAVRIFKSRPRGNLRAPRLMGAVYSQILDKMEQVGWAPPRQRVRVGRGRLLAVALRHGLF
jgi:phytoene synthase